MEKREMLRLQGFASDIFVASEAKLKRKICCEGKGYFRRSGIVSPWIEDDGRDDENRRRNCRSCVFAFGHSRSWFESDRPKWIALARVEVEGGLALQFYRWLLVGQSHVGAKE